MNFRGDSKGRDRVEATLELTPLIDVIFLLLIFFVMTTTPAMSAVEQIDVDLPDAASGTSSEAAPNNRVVFRVDSDGSIRVREGDDGQPRPVEDVEARLSDLFERNPEATVWIQGDVEASHGSVVELMDVSRRVGFDRVRMAVRPEG